MKEATEAQREVLADIFENFDGNADKIKIELEPVSKTVTVVYEDCDDEWFKWLQESAA